ERNQGWHKDNQNQGWVTRLNKSCTRLIKRKTMPRSSKRKYERSCSCKAGAVALTSSSTTVSLVGQTVVVSGKENLRGSASFCQSASCGKSADATTTESTPAAQERPLSGAPGVGSASTGSGAQGQADER
ncbi:unnamed protein product, partial [Amoebophrya sp. A25]